MLSTIQRHNKEGLFFGAIILAAGVIRFPVDNYRMLMTALFLAAATLFLAAWLWKINPWIAGFLVLAQASMYFPFYTGESYRTFQGILCGCLLYGFIVAMRPDKESILNAICIIALINVIVLVLQFFKFSPLGGWSDAILKNGHPLGLMDNQNTASALLAFCFPAFLRRKWSYFLPVILLGLVMTHSWGGMLAVICGVVFIAWIETEYGPVVGILSAVTMGVFLFIDRPGTWSRIEAWKQALSMIQQHWILGGGIGNFKLQFPAVLGARWLYLHNEILQAFFEMGVGAVVLIGGFLIRARRYERLCQMALVIILLNSLVNFPFHIGTTALVAIVWLALGELSIEDSVPALKRTPGIDH